MRVVYTSDLHGNREHYSQVLHLAVEQEAPAIILGGDLFPNSHEPARGLALQRDFARAFFMPWLWRIRTEFRALAVYVLPGNEDWASTWDLLVDLAEARLFFPLHHHAWGIDDGMWLAGSSLVPITPFAAKDWDRLEGLAPDPSFPVGGGFRSAYGLLRPVTLADIQALPTIADDLAILAVQSEPAQTIYVMHSPPYVTALDRLTDGRPVGSRAVRAFIEQYQPPLTLHGHVHEAPAISGSYTDRIGQTLCVNPGQTSERLHAVVFETHDPNRTLQHTVLRALTTAVE